MYHLWLIVICKISVYAATELLRSLTFGVHGSEMQTTKKKIYPVRPYTVDSCFLELQETLWNTSRYPYFDTSDLRN